MRKSDNITLNLKDLENAMPIQGKFTFEKRGNECVNMYIENEDTFRGRKIICWFNKKSLYAKTLENRYNIDFNKI